MSEVQSRPAAPRGRGSARGGRGGFASRGGRSARGHATNGDKVDKVAESAIDEDDEVYQLKKQYGSSVSTIKEMFPDWTDEDIVYALKETDGDLPSTVERISEGTISRWGEVSKNKKASARSKTKDVGSTTLAETTNTRPSRGGRAGPEGTRGGRGRGSDRGRGGRGRGAAAPHTNGTRHKEAADISVPTTESTAWTATKSDDKVESLDSTKAADTAGDALGAPAPVAANVAPVVPKKTWASMFKQAPPEKKPVAPKPVDAPKPPAPVPAPEPVELPSEPEPAPVEHTQEAAEPTIEEPIEKTTEEPEPSITPSKDELTEDNLEHVPDISHPPQTATQASTAASSWDPRSGATSATPYSALQQQQTPAKGVPPSGFAATALKATATPRSASFQRRILDQEEAVRMPGNREVDRAAVQFGAFNLGGDEDVDGEREEPETRQAPQQSPIAHPRTALPPAPQSAEQLPTPKTGPTAAPGLPSPSVQTASQPATQPSSQAPYNQYQRYGQPGQDQTAYGQKPYDAFNQPAPTTQASFDQAQTQAQQPTAFSSAPSDYSQYYPTDQQRSAYQNYYGQYGQQAGQDSSSTQQRSFSGYNGPQGEATAQQTQGRFAATGESQNSGHTTPNPTSQTQPQQPAQGTQPQQAHPQQPHSGQFGYNHPYFSNPYYSAYMNQYQGYGQGSYGMGPYGKGGMYNQPHQAYGMSPQNPYDHAASPAAGFGQSALHGRDALGGGLGDYNRTGSAQSAQPQGHLGGSGSFGAGVHDAFGRNSSYQGQSQHYNQQSSQPSTSDDLKPFGENAKSANGPSPALSQANRPGSAANNSSSQSGLPPSQSQQGYSGYPNHPQQHSLHGSQTASQYGGLGGIGSHQAGAQGHQNSQYGYGQQSYNSYYGNNQPRGWGGNYGHN